MMVEIRLNFLFLFFNLFAVDEHTVDGRVLEWNGDVKNPVEL